MARFLFGLVLAILIVSPIGAASSSPATDTTTSTDASSISTTSTGETSTGGDITSSVSSRTTKTPIPGASPADYASGILNFVKYNITNCKNKDLCDTVYPNISSGDSELVVCPKMGPYLICISVYCADQKYSVITDGRKRYDKCVSEVEKAETFINVLSKYGASICTNNCTHISDSKSTGTKAVCRFMAGYAKCLGEQCTTANLTTVLDPVTKEYHDCGGSATIQISILLMLMTAAMKFLL